MLHNLIRPIANQTSGFRSGVFTKATSFLTTGQRISSRSSNQHPFLLFKMNMSSSSKAEYTCVHVYVTCKPGTEEKFKEASLANARESSKEPGIARFDVIQDIEDPCKFVLVEVYKNNDAPAEHKETDHYLAWRDTVADMMAEPRKASKYINLFPSTAAGWDYDLEKELE